MLFSGVAAEYETYSNEYCVNSEHAWPVSGYKVHIGDNIDGCPFTYMMQREWDTNAKAE